MYYFRVFLNEPADIDLYLALQYNPTDIVLKLPDCGHWLHKDCVLVSPILLL